MQENHLVGEVFFWVKSFILADANRAESGSNIKGKTGIESY
jgi:hypothetical protein